MGAESDTGRHLEVERKFDVRADGVLPSFEGLAAVSRTESLPTQTLEAVYFDTPGHDLAAHKVTLRRRTGGPDAGWHLKLPAGADSRTELRAPLEPGAKAAGSEPPEELVDVVRAIVRDRPLLRVARISTIRNVQLLFGTDGSPLAEFCDDDVRAWALNPTDGSDGVEQHWHEWELELADGSVKNGSDEQAAAVLDRLSNRLLDAGGTPAGHGSKLAKVLDGSGTTGAGGPGSTRQRPEPSSDPVHRAVAEHIDELLTWDRAVRSDSYDSVHQMRVTTRKIRSLLQASDVFGLTEQAWVLDELRELAAVLGVARDAEVLAERYQNALDELPAALIRGPVHDRLVAGAKKRYQSGLRRSLGAMRSRRYFRVLDALDALAAAPPEETPGSGHAQLTLDRAYRKVRKAAKAAKAASRSATDSDHDAQIHRIRKRAKKLRYVAAATGKSKVAERAKAVQSLLGDHQDSVVSREHLTRVSNSAHAAGEDTFTYGLLYHREDDLARRCEEQLKAALKDLKKAVQKAK
jgi:CHAD domain-containing protein